MKPSADETHLKNLLKQTASYILKSATARLRASYSYCSSLIFYIRIPVGYGVAKIQYPDAWSLYLGL